MQILNFRTGFASNSSSYHSTVIAANKNSINEYLPYYFRRNKDGKLSVLKDFHGFNWEDFILTQKDTIDLYIALQIYSNFPYDTPPFIRLAVIQQVLPHTVKYLKNFDKWDGVDHQSRWTLPSSVEGPRGIPDINFIKELIDYIHNNDIVIMGGNDNSYEDDFSYNHIEKKDSMVSYIPKDYNCEKFICFKDGNVWILFNKEDGRKIRMSFNDSPIEYTKSSKPELVDLIITNRCDNGCDFCYRDCTPYKQDAPLKVVKQYIEALADRLHIPEIIIGGGDLTTYPYLEDLCDYISREKSSCNSVFNTTININAGDFSSSKKHRIELILNTFDGVAISVPRYYHTLDKLCRFLDIANYKAKISFQFIPELECNPKRVIDILKKQHFPLTMLGFKECGRAANLPEYKKKELAETRQKASEWIKYAEENMYNLGVDTQFLKNFPKAQKRWDKRTYTTEEGKFSCCIDATNHTISSSSYSDDAITLDTNNSLSNDIMEAYQTF